MRLIPMIDWFVPLGKKYGDYKCKYTCDDVGSHAGKPDGSQNTPEAPCLNPLTPLSSP